MTKNKKKSIDGTENITSNDLKSNVSFSFEIRKKNWWLPPYEFGKRQTEKKMFLKQSIELQNPFEEARESLQN